MAPKWEMIWNDEFDGDEVDLTKWNILDCPNGINNDIAYMAPHNVWWWRMAVWCCDSKKRITKNINIHLQVNTLEN